MSTALARSFRSGNHRKTRWNGQSVHSYLRLDVGDGDRIRVTRLSSSPIRAQALKLAVDHGDLRANGVLAPTVAVWSHSAPEVAIIEVVGRRARHVDLWNAWSFDGVDSAWLGHAGMIVEGDGRVYTLHCSDGLGTVSFTDLVVRVELESRG